MKDVLYILSTCMYKVMIFEDDGIAFTTSAIYEGCVQLQRMRSYYLYYFT